MLNLFEDGYKCTKKSEADRSNFGLKLRQALEEFTRTFLPHMAEEEQVCQLCQFLDYVHGHIFEPSHEKNNNLHYAKTKTQISCAVTAQLISAFVFATRIVEFLFYLYTKFQASSFILSLYRLVCVGPGRKPKLLVFPCTGSFMNELHHEKTNNVVSKQVYKLAYTVTVAG